MNKSHFQTVLSECHVISPDRMKAILRVAESMSDEERQSFADQLVALNQELSDVQKEGNKILEQMEMQVAHAPKTFAAAERQSAEDREKGGESDYLNSLLSA